VEEVPAVVPGFVDWGAVPASVAVVPEPELPQPDIIPTVITVNNENTAFAVNFIISPLSVVAPALDNKKPGLGIE
jgi:hypothetical protein